MTVSNPMKLWKKLLFAAVIIVVAAALYLLISIRSISVEQVSPDLHVLFGVGSNTTVLNTDVGAVVIDSMTFPMQGALIRRMAEELTGKPVVLLINTHYHLDHTHGNPAFQEGTRVVSTERTLSHLKALDASFWEGDRAKLLPNDTFDDELKIELGNKTITLKTLGRGHTDGDLVAVIEEEKTIVMGDLFFNQHYPNIDLEAGGSVQEWPATLDAAFALEFETVVPGHGLITDRLGMRDFQRFMGQLATIGQMAVIDETPLEEALNSDQLNADKGYTEVTLAGISIGLNREFVLRRAWQESTGNFTRKN
ncbi:MAG: MBL fold metallo-hydrolase [Arenicella sp.]|nr:MBL fold metallo-hydrolase [Arenicella sp.]